MKKRKISAYAAAGFLVLFVIWTILVRMVDVKAIGPRGSAVGMATLNSFVHRCIGVHFSLYTITDWLGLVPLLIMVVFALLGLMQWIKRKRFRYVDRSLLALGGFYLVVMAVYFFFEIVVVNYRPVLINGVLEASYPSSTTMLVMCVIPTAILQFDSRTQKNVLRKCVLIVGSAFVAFMVVMRLISGVHWFTDIVGAAFFSVGMILLYHSVVHVKET